MPDESISVTCLLLLLSLSIITASWLLPICLHYMFISSTISILIALLHLSTCFTSMHHRLYQSMCISVCLQEWLFLLYCSTMYCYQSNNPNSSLGYDNTPSNPSKGAVGRYSDTGIRTDGNFCLYGDDKVLLQSGSVKLVWPIQVADQVAVAQTNLVLSSCSHIAPWIIPGHFPNFT